jgi:hypothetical protein
MRVTLFVLMGRCGYTVVFLSTYVQLYATKESDGGLVSSQ